MQAVLFFTGEKLEDYDDDDEMDDEDDDVDDDDIDEVSTNSIKGTSLVPSQ